MSLATLQQDFEDQLSVHRVPGCTLRAWVDGSTFELQFGVADAAGTRPVSQGTVYHLYSGTKLYTAAALMRLVEGGQVSLDDPVTRVLPQLPLRDDITLRHLAAHQSGLRDTMRAFLSVRPQGQPPLSAGEALSRYSLKEGGAPGGKAAYRNVNYAILGEVIARVAGTPFETFVLREIIEPLGSVAQFSYDDALRASAAQGTMHRWGVMRWLLKLLMPGLIADIEESRSGTRIGLREFSLETAAIGGLIGTARDFLPLAIEMLRTEDGVLTAESKRAMLTLHAPGAAGIASTLGVGLGWKKGECDGELFWNHEGGGPGFASETRIYPSSNLAVVILMNVTHSRKLSWLAHSLCERIRVSMS